MEGIFPCGLVHQTGVPRPTALLYRAMALAFSRLRPAGTVPQVYLLLPDEARLGGRRGEVIRAFHRAAAILVSCRVDFAVLPDSVLGSLPASAKAIVYPMPVNPADAILDRLTAFAEAGGMLYLSGDIGYDAQRKATDGQRLRRFCGVERIGNASSPLQPTHIKLVGATAVSDNQGEPTATRYRRGKGEVWFAADPPEIAVSMKAAHRELYRSFLRAAGMPGIHVTPDDEDLRVFRVPGDDADALVLHNGGAAVEARGDEFRLQLAQGGGGFLLIGHDGTLRAIEAEGTVTRGNTPIARIQGHAFVIAMDDADLAQSGSLLVLPLAAGEIRLNRSLAAAGHAEVGETRDGQWRPLSSLPVKAEAGQWTISIPPEVRREMVRITAAGKQRCEAFTNGSNREKNALLTRRAQ